MEVRSIGQPHKESSKALGVQVSEATVRVVV